VPAVSWRINEVLRQPRDSFLCGAALVAGSLSATASAATRCVNPGRQGCFGTISAAVAAASANDVIRVSQGTYHEDVVIGKPLSLIVKAK
jgi:hypothetical protein